MKSAAALPGVRLARGPEPGPGFDTNLYLARKRDVATAGIDPLQHFIRVRPSRGAPAHLIREAGVYAREGWDPGWGWPAAHPLAQAPAFGCRSWDEPYPNRSPALALRRWRYRLAPSAVAITASDMPVVRVPSA